MIAIKNKKIMYCYECAKGGKLHYVSTGLNECIFGHNVHVDLDKQLQLSVMINEIKERKKLEESNYIREFIANEQR